MNLMTASRYKCKARCPRLHFYQYVLGIRPVAKAAPLRFGTLFHEATEQWWKAHQSRASQPLDPALDALRTYRPDEMDDFRFALIETLVRGYDAMYSPYMDRCDVLEVEAEFRVPMLHPSSGQPVPGWFVAGKIDVIVQAGGKLIGIETKTSGADLKPESFYWAKLTMDPQISAYMDGAKHLTNGRSYELDRMTYDVARKPAAKPKKATADIKMTKGRTCGTKASPCPGRSCEACEGTGYKEQPRPRKGQQLADETVEEYRERIVSTIAEDPTAYYHRHRIARTEEDLAVHRREFARAALECATFQPPDDWVNRTDYGRNMAGLPSRYWMPPRNLQACAQGSSVCAFFDVCQGARGLDAPQFQQIGPHPELSQGAI